MPRARPPRGRDAFRHGLRLASAHFTVWTYTLLAPFGCGVLALLSFAWRRDPVKRARRMQRVTIAAYRFMHDWLSLADITRFDHRTALAEVPRRPSVVIANHPTLMDVTAISAVLGSGCTIVKPGMYHRRLLHGLLAGAGHIEGPGKDLVSVGTVVDEAVQRLHQGFSVIVFPEGTRSPAGRLLPFGRIAFEIACRAAVPLVSLTVECEPLYLSKNVTVLHPPHPTPELRLGLLSIDDPASFGHDSKLLRRRVEGRYRAWLARPVPATVPFHPTEETRCPTTISKTG